MFQMGGVGPMIGQTHHFREYAPEKIDYAIQRYTNETRRLYGVMDKQLAGSKFIACNQYTIADIAIFPWLRNWQNHGIDWADYPHLQAWFDRIAARPAVQRGVQVLADLRRPSPMTRRARCCLARCNTRSADFSATHRISCFFAELPSRWCAAVQSGRRNGDKVRECSTNFYPFTADR